MHREPPGGAAGPLRIFYEPAAGGGWWVVSSSCGLGFAAVRWKMVVPLNILRQHLASTCLVPQHLPGSITHSPTGCLPACPPPPPPPPPRPLQSVPSIDIPLHTVMELTPKADGTMAETRFIVDVDKAIADATGWLGAGGE